MRWIKFTKLTKNLMTMLVRYFYAKTKQKINKKQLEVDHEMALLYLSTLK